MAVDELRFRVMASDAHVIIVDGASEACDNAQRALEQLEHIWSRFIDSSDVFRLNHSTGMPIQVAPATILLIEIMAKAWKLTDGRYDPTILPALLAAGYVNSVDDPDFPSTIRIDTSHPGTPAPSFGHVEIGPNRFVTLPATVAIDAGGIGKGLAADLVCTELLDQGASGALISIGGDLSAAGTGPEKMAGESTSKTPSILPSHSPR